jgi:hypothetical protein
MMTVLARHGRAAAAALLLPLLFPVLLLTACGHAAAPVSPPVTLGFCGSAPQVRPDVVLVVCNTDDITATNLIWSGWGEATATARGSATVNLRAYTDCASGDYISVPIDVAVSKIVRCSPDTQAYSTLRYVFPDGSPFRGISATASAPGLFGGHNQPVPPADQTVSLTC